MSAFWSWWVIIIVAIMIIGSFVLLHLTRKMDDNGEETTGHVYDGIEEYNNPMPKWWLNLFYITLIFGIGYLFLFPGLGSYQGYLGWSKEKAWQKEVEEANRQYGPLFEQYKNTPITELIKDEQAMDMGRRIFQNVCFACHGTDAGGKPGFPNLKDDDWLYGGSPETIQQTVLFGRNGTMPAFGQSINEEQISQLVSYVRSLSGKKEPEHQVKYGEALFKQNCVACHGADGKGNRVIGAPNLTDNIWLYGGSRKVIARTIRNGRQGHMPAHKEILGEAKVHLVAAYVYSLSHQDKQQAE